MAMPSSQTIALIVVRRAAWLSASIQFIMLFLPAPAQSSGSVAFSKWGYGPGVSSFINLILRKNETPTRLGRTKFAVLIFLQ